MRRYMSTEISIIYLHKTPSICFSLHNTFGQFQAELAMSSHFFFVLSFCSILELCSLLIASVSVYLPCVIHNWNLSLSDRFTGEIILSDPDWSVTNSRVFPSIAGYLKLDVAITLLPSKNAFSPVLLTMASSWGARLRNICNHCSNNKVDCTRM